MRQIWFFSLAAALSLHGADSLDAWFKEGKVSGNVKYYYIDTAKETGTAETSAHANSIGGKLGYVSGSLHGLKLGATFMTTNPFAIPNDPAGVDTSILGKDNGVRTGVASEGDDGFSVLGEVYALYGRDSYELWYGRKVINTPLMDAKEVRMLPSAFEGGMATLKLDESVTLGAGFIDKFKQRTSDRFTDVIEHALGANTVAITGNSGGYVLPVSLQYQGGAVKTRVYDYYAKDFMNSIYADASFENKLGNKMGYTASVQGIVQDSIGNADSPVAQGIMGGKINAQALGAKVSFDIDRTNVVAACTHVFSNGGDHDSLVLPWDGTPLFTNMITSNNLFISNYGKGLESDTAYIGGTTGIKLGISQKFDIAGFQGFSAGMSYAHYSNGRFPHDQDDLNGEFGYGVGNFSLALKGIWVHDNTSANTNNTLKAQNDKLTQYRVIANYNF